MRGDLRPRWWPLLGGLVERWRLRVLRLVELGEMILFIPRPRPVPRRGRPVGPAPDSLASSIVSRRVPRPAPELPAADASIPPGTMPGLDPRRTPSGGSRVPGLPRTDPGQASVASLGRQAAREALVPATRADEHSTIEVARLSIPIAATHFEMPPGPGGDLLERWTRVLERMELGREGAPPLREMELLDTTPREAGVTGEPRPGDGAAARAPSDGGTSWEREPVGRASRTDPVARSAAPRTRRPSGVPEEGGGLSLATGASSHARVGGGGLDPRLAGGASGWLVGTPVESTAADIARRHRTGLGSLLEEEKLGEFLESIAGSDWLEDFLFGEDEEEDATAGDDTTRPLPELTDEELEALAPWERAVYERERARERARPEPSLVDRLLGGVLSFLGLGAGDEDEPARASDETFGPGPDPGQDPVYLFGEPPGKAARLPPGEEGRARRDALIEEWLGAVDGPADPNVDAASSGASPALGYLQPEMRLPRPFPADPAMPPETAGATRLDGLLPHGPAWPGARLGLAGSAAMRASTAPSPRWAGRGRDGVGGTPARGRAADTPPGWPPPSGARLPLLHTGHPDAMAASAVALESSDGTASMTPPMPGTTPLHSPGAAPVVRPPVDAPAAWSSLADRIAADVLARLRREREIAAERRAERRPEEEP